MKRVVHFENFVEFLFVVSFCNLWCSFNLEVCFQFIDDTMAMRQTIFLFTNCLLMVLVAGQTELIDKDVEIIPGKNIEQLSDANPLDAKYAGQFANIYAQPVSWCSSNVVCSMISDSFCFVLVLFIYMHVLYVLEM